MGTSLQLDKMVRAVLVCAAVCLVGYACAQMPPHIDTSNLMQFTQGGNATDADAGTVSPDLAIMSQVETEMMIARTYLDIVLKVQGAYYNKKAAIAMMTMFHEIHGEKSLPEMGPALFEEDPEDGDNADADEDEADDEAAEQQANEEDEEADENDEEAQEGELEEEGLNEFGETTNDFEDDVSFLEVPDLKTKATRLDLISKLDLFTAIKVRMYQTVFTAADLQKEFFLNRGLQLRLLSLGGALPSEYANLMYLQMFKTFLSTQKVSKSFEVVSTWTTWLEDELDAARAKSGVANVNRMDITSSKDELAEDRIFAFTAYANLAYIEMSEFMMESYLEYTMGANYKPAADAVTPGEAPASFLETETSTEAKFVPTMLQFTGQTYYAQKLYRMYFLYYQYAAASSGLQSCYANSKKVKVGGPRAKLSKALFFKGFLPNLVYASDIQLVTAMWQMYYVLQPMMGQQQSAAQH